MSFFKNNLQSPVLGGLAGWWRFNENNGTTAHDSSINGFTGNLHGSPNWISNGGIINGALNFSGSTQWISSTSSSVSLFAGVSFASISLWMKNSGNGTLTGGFCQENNSGPYRFCIQLSAGIIYVCAEGSASSFYNVSISSLGTTNWFHVVFIFNGYNSAATRDTVYINGVAQTLTAGGNNPTGVLGTFTQLPNFLLGDVTTATGQAQMMDVRFYNRVLKPFEVQILYNSKN